MHIGCKKFACVFCLFLVGFLSFICNPYVAYGDTDGSAAVNVTRENILAIILGGDVTSGSASINVMTNSLNAVFNETGDITATVISTGANGYTLSMDSSTSALTSTGSQATIDELAESANGYERASFPANKWGYSLKTGNEYGNYFGMGDGVELQDVSEPTAGTISTLRLGASIDSTIPDGSYSTAIVFTLTAKVESRLYMQDVTPAICPTEPTTVVDSRDGEEYTIQQLADGNCWLLDNLRLDLSITGNLTSADTNITTNWIAPVDIATWSSDSYIAPKIDTDSKNDTGYGYEAGKFGIYYNYCAATAGTYCYAEDSGTGNATQDICPKGWRMPTGDNSGEYNALYVAYNSDIDSFIDMLRTPFPGYFTGGSVNDYGTDGNFWSSTYGNDSDVMYYLDVFADAIWQSTYYRSGGLSVRCVLKEPEPQLTAMQDITAATCPTTPTTVVDNRDGEEYTIQQLADGNCWLLDNLRLDLTDPDVQDNLTADTTNASNTTLNYLMNGGGTTSDQYATAGVSKWTNSDSFSAPLIGTAYKDTTGTGGYEAGKYGVYYNCCAASAGSYCYGDGTSEGVPSDDATEDICPKGWRMPTGGESGEYQALYTAYSSNNADFANALRIPLAGYFDYGSALAQGSYGVFWSSTRRGNANLYTLYFGGTSGANPKSNGYRLSGQSVRCILK